MARQRGPGGPPRPKSFFQRYQWFIIGGVALFFVISVIIPAFQGGATEEPADDSADVPADDAPSNVEGEFHFPATNWDHIPFGVRGSGYNSDPPTSGQHWNEGGLAPTTWGMYTSPVADEALIHNMEHGGIIAYYRASAPATEIEQLKQFIQAQPGFPRGFIVAPRATLPADITLAAWEYYLPVFQYDEANMTAFIRSHYDQGRESLDGGPR